MSAKGAVIIGVDKTGGLDELQSAAVGAGEVAEWLTAEGYDVKLLTDSAGPLHAADVKTALKSFVTNPVSYDLLVVYFSGHGMWHARADRWLFTDAPTDTSDAINLEGAIALARYSGIETVVFISDACRSAEVTAVTGKVGGIDAFPNLPFDRPSKVDVVKATSPATAAFEAIIPPEVGGSGDKESVLTLAWRSAYGQATPGMIREVEVDGQPVPVVPNRELEDFLQPRVDELLAAVDINLVQNLEINIPSQDHVFIARVDVPSAADDSEPDLVPGSDPGGPEVPIAAPIEAPSKPPRPRIGDAVRDVLFTGGGAPGLDSSQQLEFDRRLPRHDLLDHYESECGFLVEGVAVTDIAVVGGDSGAWGEIVNQDQPALVRVWDVSPATSIVMQFEDRRSTMLPAFRGYIGHLTVDETGVVDVAYVPSSNDWRYGMYQNRQAEIDQLRALVAMSIEADRFVFRDPDELGALADQIRIGKSLDPTLGVYAALAYFEAGMSSDVESVLNYMAQDLGTSVLDVVMLAARHIEVADWPTVPLCPVLTQNWNLLRPHGFELPAVLDELAPHLQDSLWTTFGAEAGTELLEAVRDGVLR